MARQRSLDRNGRRLLVSNLTDQHHIRIGTKNRTQRGGKGHTRLIVHLHLIDALHAEFHRVFNRDDVDFRAGHIAQRRIQRGRLTRTGRTSHQHHAVRAVVRFGKHIEIAFAEIQILYFEIARRRAQNTHDDFLAPHRRQCRHAKINLLTVVTYGNTAILRLATLADIHFGHDLNAADHTLGHGAWRFLEDMQHAVDAVAYEQTVFLRFDMDIGAVVVDGLVDEQTYEACHGGGIFAVVLFKVDFFFRGRGDLVR